MVLRQSVGHQQPSVWEFFGSGSSYRSCAGGWGWEQAPTPSRRRSSCAAAPPPAGTDATAVAPLDGGVAAAAAIPLAGGCDEAGPAALVFPLAHFCVRRPLLGGFTAASAGARSGGALRVLMLTSILALAASLCGGSKAAPVSLVRSSAACRSGIASACLLAALIQRGNGDNMAGCGSLTAATRHAHVDTRSQNR